MQTADHPHNSFHEPTRANGTVRAESAASLPGPQATAHAARCGRRGGGVGTASESGEKVTRAFVASVGTNANDWCKNNTVRVTGYGYVIDVGREEVLRVDGQREHQNPWLL